MLNPGKLSLALPSRKRLCEAGTTGCEALQGLQVASNLKLKILAKTLGNMNLETFYVNSEVSRSEEREGANKEGVRTG